MFGSFVPEPESGIPYWKYHSVQCNQTIKGWKAGHLVGIPSHNLGATKPCAERFTKGELKCSLDHAEHVVKFHAYMPLITDDEERLVVGVRKNQFPKACEIPVGEQIVVSRAHRMNLPVLVRPKKWGSYRYCTCINPLEPADIDAWLLRLWKMPALTAWILANPEKVRQLTVNTSALVKAAPGTAAELPPPREEVMAGVKLLKAGLARWEGKTSLNSTAHADEVDPLDLIPKVLDVSSLPAHHPVRKRYAKGGAK